MAKKKKPCGCQKANLKLSKGLKARCLTKDEYKSYSEFKQTKGLNALTDNTKYICKLYADVFSRPYYEPKINTSTKPIIKMLDSLDIVYDNYIAK